VDRGAVVQVADGLPAGVAADLKAAVGVVILGIDVATAEVGAGWLAFLRSLMARGLCTAAHPATP